MSDDGIRDMEIADRLNEERCLRCGRELEVAGPYGPLFCPACDPHLDPEKEPPR